MTDPQALVGVDGQSADAPNRPPIVVGIGASAGGLEALEAFFANLPPAPDMAFVVVQHLSPDFRSVMDQLLARHTTLEIRRVENDQPVDANVVYLLPPKSEMIISGGRFLVTEKDPHQGLHLPIDTFFRSLAQDCGNRCVGVILSGTGSDGSRGIRAIHDAGGLVIAQSEESAKFDGMPRSAIETGMCDYVLPVDQIPPCLLELTQQQSLDGTEAWKPIVPSDALESIFKQLRSAYGIDFAAYKPTTVHRRIERRLQLGRVTDLDEYLSTIQSNPDELNALYRDLLIGVTKFFRDPEAFLKVGQEVIRPAIRRLEPHDEFRLWVAGCATGEEAYTLAILVREAIDELQRPVQVKLFATDVHRSSLDVAANGIYSGDSLENVSPERLERHFSRHGEQYQVRPELRRLLVFAEHNIIRDAPFTRLDLISCRNLLIYLRPSAQRKAISMFHFGLKPGAAMFLGPSENAGDLSEDFEIVDGHWKVFRKRRDGRTTDPWRLQTPRWSALTTVPRGGDGPSPLPNPAVDPRPMEAFEDLLQDFLPPTLLIGPNNELMHTLSGAGKFLTPRDGRVSLDVLEMVDRDLRIALAGAIPRVRKDRKPVCYRGVHLNSTAGPADYRLTVKPISRQDPTPGVLAIFLEPLEHAPADASGQDFEVAEASEARMKSLEEELRHTKENLQASIEELETSNEELQATNEELVASNEELQSTNEELHSVNEELYTVNAEYQKKILELTQLSEDVDNLLQSTNIGTIFLDSELRIRKFTPQIADTFYLLPQDVGRRIDTFAHTVEYGDLLSDAREVLDTGSGVERQVRNARGQWFLMRILPYLSRAKRDGGIVITFVDISALKEAEEELRLSELRNRTLIRALASIVFRADVNGDFFEIGDDWQAWTGQSGERASGRGWLDAVHEADRSNLATNWDAVVQGNRDYFHAEFRLWNQAKQEYRYVEARAACVRNADGTYREWIGKILDIHQRQVLEQQRREYSQQLVAANTQLLESISRRERAEQEAREAVVRRDRFLAMLSHELRNPLAAILNAAYVVERSGDVPDFLEQPMQVVQRQSRQMARLLDDLLDVSRVMQDKIQMRREVLDLRETMAHVLEAAGPLFQARGVTLHSVRCEEPLYVFGDAGRLQQIQTNLLSNAAKYAAEGGEAWYEMDIEGDEAVIRVRDNGEGIAAEMLEPIFDLFFQAGRKDVGHDGMGVGLTLVRTLVEKHGGSVAAASEGPGHGSQFTVRLPLTPNRPVGQGRASDSVDSVRRIVIVEDNADSRNMLQMLLRMDGFEVHSAEDGAQGLNLILEQQPHAALVDIGLPVMDGCDVAREVRRRQGPVELFLVALTGFGRAEDRARVIDAGFDEHLVKPLHPDRLREVLSRVGSR